MAGGKRGYNGDNASGVRISPDPYHVGGARSQSTSAKDAKSHLHAGRIIHVDTETMVCSIALDSIRSEHHDVPLPAPGGSGPRSWAGVIPESGTKVIIGWKKFDNRGSYSPYIVEFLSVGTFPAREYEPFSSVDPDDAAQALIDMPSLADDPHLNMGVIRLKARKGYSGDFIASSSSGSDIILDRDVFFTNRAGNEFRLRDSDQSSVLNVRNEFTSNSAGYYSRGLIKRSAFNFLPDLYPLDNNGNPSTVISPGNPVNGINDGDGPQNGEPLDRNPAYNTLLSFGLINDDGTLNFIPSTTSAPNYPYVVQPDGQYVSYITHGSASSGFGDTPYAYTEDRFEMRMTDDGVMKVTEDGDGFQIDPPYPLFIEDVRGTVVGNDFHTSSGRTLYGKVLGMSVFRNSKQRQLSDMPILEPIDPITRLDWMDYVGLARFFRITNPDPDNANQFAFGITKEGRVLCHIPKTKIGEPDDIGRSLDMNILGMVKAVIGAAPGDPHQNKSLDLRLLGGAEIEIGRFGASTDQNSTSGGESLKLILNGGVITMHNGDPITGIASSTTMNGSKISNINGTVANLVTGSVLTDSGAEIASKGQKMTDNVGPGGYSLSCSGDKAETILGHTQAQYAQICILTYAVGRTTLHIAGIDATTMIAGAITRTLGAGAGITDTVVTGNIVHTVATGSISSTVGTGNWTAQCGAGSLTLIAAGGPAVMASSLIATISAGTIANVIAPLVNIGSVPVGCVVAGIPGPPGPMLDYICGIPFLGVSTVTV